MRASGPVVSVVVTVYNGEGHLAEALSSVLGQSFGDLEVVLVDDGSTDQSLHVARAFPDPRLRVISEGRLGRARALNRALEAATGRYIALMDADDVALPTRIERQVRFLEEHPKVGFVGTWFTAVSPEGEPLYTKTTLLRDADIRRRFLLGVPIAGGTTMVRREVFEQVGTFREEFVPSEDADLWRRAIIHFEAANIPEVLYLYRMTPGSYSHVQGDLQERHRRAIVSDMWKRFDVPRYGVADVRRARTFYAGQPTRLAEQLEEEYLKHESELATAFLRRGRVLDATALTIALLRERPTLAPGVGRVLRGARRLLSRDRGILRRRHEP